VSKFFKALEKAEQEREAIASTVVKEPAAPAPAPPAPPTAKAAPVTPKPAPPAPTMPPTPASKSAPTPAAPPPAPPAPVSTPAAAPIAPAPAPARPASPAPSKADPVAAPAAPSPFAAPPAPRPAAPRPAYGAPIARESMPFGRRGFAWQMEPAPHGDTGAIDDHLVSLLAPTSFAAEQYRAVRLAIETSHRERGTRVVAVASPGRGDGKTITALNLAGALAQASDARVVLLEADLRHPTVSRYLGLPAARGLASYLPDTTMELETVLQRPPTIAFSVITAGAHSSMPYELLKSPRLAALIAELRERFDYVLVDTPPALPIPDVGILRDLVDGFVLVVRANRTPRETLSDTLGVLGRPRTLGLVFNDDDRTAVPTLGDREASGWRRFVAGPMGAARA
jgi:capsular exopolysaccharide synthesis family protein